MKLHGSLNLTAAREGGGAGLRARQHAFAYGSRLIARGRARARLDYGAVCIAIAHKRCVQRDLFKL